MNLTAPPFTCLSLFQELTGVQQTKLFSFGQVKEVATGKTIIEEGTDNKSLHVLLSGSCEIRKTVSDRGLGQFKEVLLDFTENLVIFGETSFLGKQPSPESVLTKELCTFWTISDEEALLLRKSDPELAFLFNQLVSQHLAQRMHNFLTYPTRKIDEFTPNIKYLNRNENHHFSEEVKNALLESILENKPNFYPDAYSENVVAKLAPLLGVAKEWVVVTAGSSICIDLVAQAYVNENSKVTILSPTFEVFGFSTRNQKATIEEFSYKHPYQANVEEFITDSNPESDIIYIANPNTPTGLYHSNDQILELVRNRPNSLFIIDEAYIEFSSNPEGVLPLLKAYPEKFIIIRTMSKAYGLAGLRLGYAIGHPNRLVNLRNRLIPYSVNAFSQIAACAILGSPWKVTERVKEICQQRELMAKGLRELGYRVEVGPTNFMLVFVKNALDLIKVFRNYDVLVRYVSSPHRANYLGECIRISVGTEEDTRKVLEVAKLLKERTDS